ncbi:MAG: hypothetical protein EXQ79_10480 [Acidimicrobiia bacterium]|nr:hypothetical protein [Acidimicrobiia bacterium]
MKSYKVLFGVTIINVGLVAAAWFGIVGAQPSGAQSRDGVLEASGFDLVNDEGTVVAQLYVGDDGTGQIRLRDASGEVRVKIGASPDGAGLILFNGQGEPVPGVWAVTDEQGAKITLVNGETRKVLKP